MLKLFVLSLAMIAGLALIDVAQAQQPETIVLTKDNHLVIRGPIGAQLISKKQQELLDLIAKNDGLIKKNPIYIILDTPGGSVAAGNAFIDTANLYKGYIHTVTLFAASMGYHIAQSLGTRYILPSGVLMSHRATLNGVGGQLPGELNTMINFISDMLLDMDKAAAKRVGMSVDSYRKLIYDEYWVTGKNAVTNNHADKLALVKCDSSLSGTENQSIDTIFGPVEAVFSKCPIIRGPLEAKFKGDRQALEKAATRLIQTEVSKFFRKAVLSN